MIKNQHWTINCDMGEGMANDEEIMPLVDLCNIACGGHFGDRNTMSRTVALALDHDVLIGAHPSFPDRENFGRKHIQLSPEILQESLREQIASLRHVCQTQGADLHHLKPHGALYNAASKDQHLAQIILEVAAAFGLAYLMAPWQSEMARLAPDFGISVIYEAFADRGYQSDGSLADRSFTGALITSGKEAAAQAKGIIEHHALKSLTGEDVTVYAHTLCVHSDNPAAMDILKSLNALKK